MEQVRKYFYNIVCENLFFFLILVKKMFCPKHDYKLS